jgi:hypothetical protein
MPQPTAPFSSPAPTPVSHVDRVIEAPESIEQKTDIADLINQELNGMSSNAPVQDEQPAPIES